MQQVTEFASFYDESRIQLRQYCGTVLLHRVLYALWRRNRLAFDSPSCRARFTLAADNRSPDQGTAQFSGGRGSASVPTPCVVALRPVALHAKKTMLPIRLTLHNFLPYRAPDPIVFEGLHLACLSGPNGAGKSSLLDAITWALWGRARGRNDIDLITLGADEMRVELDFEQEGGRYRVVRERSRKRRQGRLSFFTLAEGSGSGGYTDSSGENITTTQTRINRLLRLDYETFVHSAFLQQGQADAFTIKPPAQRKQILADILGLDAWAAYEGRAKDRLRQIDTALENIAGRLTEIEDEIAREPLVRQDLAAAESAYAETEAALRAAEARYEELADAPAQLRAATDRLADLVRRLKEYADDENALLAEQERLAQRVTEYEQVIAERDSIETGYATLAAARDEDRSLSDKLLALQSAEARRAELQTQIAAARARLEAEAASHHQTIRELSGLTSEADAIAASLDATRDSLAALAVQESERDRLQAEVAALNEESAALRSHNDALRDEMNAIKARLDTLNAAPADSAICPTCQQPLAPQQRAALIEQFQADGTARGDQYRANLGRVETIRAEVAAHRQAIDALLPELRQLEPLRERLGRLRAEQTVTRDADARLSETEAALASIEAALDGDTYAQEARAALEQVEREIATLGYDRGAHTAARENLDSYQGYESRHQQLQIALDALPEAQQALQAARRRAERLRRVQAEDERAHAETSADVERLKALQAEANRRYDETRERRTALQVAAEKRARAQQSLNALGGLRDRREVLITRREELRDQQDLYTDLRDAFGKNGIPALMIEAALPELEATANDLLARMSDGGMRVQFRTTRATASGGEIETLDLIIADELGERDYSLYSGGEAFRINFAVRIALSRLLAGRAGAHLRTLFIDEGFGTQDASGRERLVEAINAVAADFDLILVITHVEELRDVFPAQLVVEKTASGSRVQLG
ncbi:MAG: SMC family ATPase [Anaerolineae bacterium]|nr:SMC family ATPase [Anaerolineae bacterium]